MCPHSPESQRDPGCIQSSGVREGICPAVLHCETPPGALRPHVESSAQQKRRPVGTRPGEGHNNGLRGGTPFYGDRLRAGAAQPREEKAPGRPFGIQRDCKKEEVRLFNRVCCDRTRGNGFKLKEGSLWLGVRKKFFSVKSGEALEQVAQRCDGCALPGNIQGQAGWGSEQLDLAVGVPVHCRGV